MKKVFFSIGLSILITLSFIGCTKTDTSKDNTTSQKSSQDTSEKQTTIDKNSSKDENSQPQVSNSQNKNNNLNDNQVTNSQNSNSSFNNDVNSKQNTQKYQKQVVGKVTFCEDVDNNLNPINSSTRFTTGQIYARLQSTSPFNTSRIKITLLYVDGASEIVLDSTVQDCNPAWTVYAFPVTTVDTGTYKVIIMDDVNNTKLGEGSFTAEGI